MEREGWEEKEGVKWEGKEEKGKGIKVTSGPPHLSECGCAPDTLSSTAGRCMKRRKYAV